MAKKRVGETRHVSGVTLNGSLEKPFHEDVKEKSELPWRPLDVRDATVMGYLPRKAANREQNQLERKEYTVCVSIYTCFQVLRPNVAFFIVIFITCIVVFKNSIIFLIINVCLCWVYMPKEARRGCWFPWFPELKLEIVLCSPMWVLRMQLRPS